MSVEEPLNYFAQSRDKEIFLNKVKNNWRIGRLGHPLLRGKLSKSRGKLFKLKEWADNPLGFKSKRRLEAEPQIKERHGSTPCTWRRMCHLHCWTSDGRRACLWWRGGRSAKREVLRGFLHRETDALPAESLQASCSAPERATSEILQCRWKHQN